MTLELETSAPTCETSAKTALEIVTGRRASGRIVNKRLAGYAYLPVGSNVYEVKLLMFPRHTYFMRQNKDYVRCYTVYSKRAWVEGQTKLSSPIGYGSIPKDSFDCIEIYFPLLGRMVFLDLIPKNFQEASNG